MATVAPPISSPHSFGAKLRKLIRRPQFWFALAVLVPTFVWYTIFLYRPIIMGLQISVVRYTLLAPEESPFVGLQNFANVLSNDRFWIALGNSFRYAFLTYVIGLPIALFIAWCLVSTTRGRPIYQFIIFLPVVVSVVAISMLFRMLMDPQMGALNIILRSLGLPTSKFIASSDTAMISIAIVDVWKGFGFITVLLATAMLNVPQTIYDAAKVDGATGWSLFSKITLPLIAPTLLLVSVLTVMGGLQTYVFVMVLGPGPGTSTLLINQLIVEEAFRSWHFGFATAASLIMFLIILGLTLIQLHFLQPRWEY